MEDKEIVVRPLTLEPVEKKEKKTDSGETASLVGASLDSGALNDSIYRFNSKQGHGFAAERANTRIDLLYGREASILGDNNAKNGPDGGWNPDSDKVLQDSRGKHSSRI